jgi:hypothetical protein
MSDLVSAIRTLAEQLALTCFAGPPVDVRLLAERLGIAIEPTFATPRWTLALGVPTIFLPPDLPPERARFILAHEILELECARAEPPIVPLPDETDRAEGLYQAGASDLLMPQAWFEGAGADTDWDLAELRRRFDVSWEAATRRVPVCAWAVGTIIDNGRVTARVGSPGLHFRRRLEPPELETVNAAYEAWPGSTPTRREADGLRCAAWPALPERNGIRRVCLLTFPDGG